jgi:hypothetical protein
MRWIIGWFCLLTSAAYAQAPQAQPPPQQPNEQALANKLMQEIGGNLQCQAQVISLQREIDDLKKKLAEKK